MKNQIQSWIFNLLFWYKFGDLHYLNICSPLPHTFIEKKMNSTMFVINGLVAMLQNHSHSCRRSHDSELKNVLR